jgi:hypothetical protein
MTMIIFSSLKQSALEFHFIVDSFKRSSKMKSHLLFEVKFVLFYAQKERNLSEFNLAKMVRGIRFKTPFKFSGFLHKVIMKTV